MVTFEMAYKEAKVESNLNLFRHYYHIKRTKGFYYVCGRSLSKDFLTKSKGPSAGWRKRYFMVKKKLSGKDEVEKREWERPEAGFRYFTVIFRNSIISETYIAVHGGNQFTLNKPACGPDSLNISGGEQ